MAYMDYNEDQWVVKARVLVKTPDLIPQFFSAGNTHYELPVEDICNAAQIYSCLCRPSIKFPTINLFENPLSIYRGLEKGKDYIAKIILPNSVDDFEKFYRDNKLKVLVSRIGYEKDPREAWLTLREQNGIASKLGLHNRYLEGADSIFKAR